MLRNCTSQHALENTMSDFNPPVNEPNNPNAQSFVEALKRDLIAIACGIVNTIRSSQLRHVEFKDIVEMGNLRRRWQNEDGQDYQIKSLNLIRDSPLHWGSTYLMIN